jgi:hypothetical protein
MNLSYYLNTDSLLNLSNITSKIHTVAVPVIFYLQTIFIKIILFPYQISHT